MFQTTNQYGIHGVYKPPYDHVVMIQARQSGLDRKTAGRDLKKNWGTYPAYSSM